MLMCGLGFITFLKERVCENFSAVRLCVRLTKIYDSIGAQSQLTLAQLAL